MSTRAYFIGGPLDGHVADFDFRPPSSVPHTIPQQELALGAFLPAATINYEKHFVIDDSGSSMHYYVPEGRHASALRDLLEQRLKEKNGG